MKKIARTMPYCFAGFIEGCETYLPKALTSYDLHDFTREIEDCERVLAIKPDFSPAGRLKTAIEMKIFG
ncbi:MAG: hypothetical protein ACMUIL_06320 [bacterium]